MKKIIAIILFLVITLSLCACNTFETPDGETKENLQKDLTFIITERIVSPVGNTAKFIFRIENDQYDVLFYGNDDIYMDYAVGDEFKCDLKIVDWASNDYNGSVKYDGHSFTTLEIRIK